MSELRSSAKVVVDVLGSPFPAVRTVSVDVKHHVRRRRKKEVVSELRSFVEVEVDVPATPSLTVGTVSEDVKQH